MSPLLIDYLRHVRDQCDGLIELSNTMSYEELSSHPWIRLGAVKSLEIIGEALKRVPREDLSDPNVPWRQLIRMRDRMAHGYLDIDFKIVWDVMIVVVPVLRPAIDQMIREQEQHRDAD